MDYTVCQCHLLCFFMIDAFQYIRSVKFNARHFDSKKYKNIQSSPQVVYTEIKIGVCKLWKKT